MTTTANLNGFLTSNNHAGRLSYRFPNGVNVSVIPDCGRPFAWEMEARTVDPTGRWQPANHGRLDPTGVAVGLSTDDAETLLTELANLPRHEED